MSSLYPEVADVLQARWLSLSKPGGRARRSQNSEVSTIFAPQIMGPTGFDSRLKLFCKQAET